MSLLRVLPALRSRAAHRACTASFSSSASTSAAAGGSANPPPDIFSALSDAAESPPAEPLDPIEDAPAVEDGPPRPSADSYPRNAPRNPVTEANRAKRLAEVRPLYSVAVQATRNNTIITFARPSREGGGPLVTLTGGKLGFKKSNRNGYEAGYQCAVGIIAAMKKESERREFEWELFLKGFGQGRDAMLTAITTAVGAEVKESLVRVTDRTPIKIGGTRGKKARRI
ncbi:hypothetical protein BD413DRAFT_547163 [Trametes elegans]|nr:hypothetical protein BD413DRAFT_547163 [Trametes elegans]